MNVAVLMGRLVADPELRTTQSGVSVTTFRIAVDRNYQVKGEDRKADFFNVVAWRSNAEFISRYFFKGRMILLDGELQTRQYVDKNNVSKDIVEIIVDNASFTGEPKAQQQQQQGGGGSYQNYNNYNNYQGNQNTSTAPLPALSQGSAQDFVESNASDDDYPF